MLLPRDSRRRRRLIPTAASPWWSAFAAGSGADILARYYATKLADETGQTVVVENKPGANGLIAAQGVKQAKPDGYTLLFSPSAGMAGGKFLYANLPYDPQKDFIIAAPLLDVAFALTVGASSPAKIGRGTDGAAQEQAEGALRHQPVPPASRRRRSTRR